MTENSQPQQPTQPPSIDKSLGQSDELLLPKPHAHIPKLFIIGIVVSFILVGWVFYNLILKDNKEQTIPLPVVTQSPKQKIGISENWTTYKSNFGYSINHPSTWIEHTDNWQENGSYYSVKDDDELVISFSESDSTKSGQIKGVLVSLKKPLDNTQSLSVKEWYKRNFPALSFIQSENITVNTTESLKVVSILDKRIVNIFIPDKNKVYQITYEPLTGVNQESTYDYEAIFNQILSTFQFNSNF